MPVRHQRFLSFLIGFVAVLVLIDIARANPAIDTVRAIHLTAEKYGDKGTLHPDVYVLSLASIEAATLDPKGACGKDKDGKLVGAISDSTGHCYVLRVSGCVVPVTIWLPPECWIHDVLVSKTAADAILADRASVVAMLAGPVLFPSLTSTSVAGIKGNGDVFVNPRLPAAGPLREAVKAALPTIAKTRGYSLAP